MSEYEDCHEIAQRVYEFHDGELTLAEADQIREHLLGCEPCLGKFEVERAMRVLIKRAFNESAPEGLLDRIKGGIQGVLPA
jgi:anti-sigma factor (TIGR02949 family)